MFCCSQTLFLLFSPSFPDRSSCPLFSNLVCFLNLASCFRTFLFTSSFDVLIAATLRSRHFLKPRRTSKLFFFSFLPVIPVICRIFFIFVQTFRSSPALPSSQRRTNQEPLTQASRPLSGGLQLQWQRLDTVMCVRKLSQERYVACHRRSQTTLLVDANWNALVVLFCSLAVLNTRVGHTIDVLSPSLSSVILTDFRGESCPRLYVVHPGRAWSSLPATVKRAKWPSKAIVSCSHMSYIQFQLSSFRWTISNAFVCSSY